jgi:hypothetical protein
MYACFASAARDKGRESMVAETKHGGSENGREVAKLIHQIWLDIRF